MNYKVILRAIRFEGRSFATEWNSLGRNKAFGNSALLLGAEESHNEAEKRRNQFGPNKGFS